MNANTRGRGWARFGALLGGVISVAANVAHSYIPPTDAPADWQPMPGAVVGSVVWPVILFVAIEILVRVAWPVGRWWAVLRFGGMIPVAFVAGIVSYRHLSSLLTYYGEDRLVSGFGPLAIDGLMIMATGALLVIGHRTTTDTTAVPDNSPDTQDVRPRPQDVPAPSPTPQPVPDSRPGSVPAVLAPAAPVPAIQDRPGVRPEIRPEVRPEPVRAEVVRAVVPAPVEATAQPFRSWPTAPLPAGMLDTARGAAARFAAEHGRQIRRDELQKILRVSNSTTGDVMAALGLTTPRTPITAVNGTER
ncbi:hypothetical protein [Catellatospora sichuanensis]|uniref:hypothetical protein n=1 Tax=Catellatospora sichuanensis TaxID=1969805 RepID=UPI001182A54C|nr:hypothetical protein [Catellatospora sichuanensis]